MDKLSKIYFINLDRRPDRYEHFLKQCSEHKIDFSLVQRYTAIDGLTYNFTLEEKNFFLNSDYRTETYAKKIMGNQLSHYYILNEMILKNYENIIIFQDDVLFRNDFLKELNLVLNNIPDNTEIINIGFHKFAAYNKFIPWDIKNNEEDLNMSHTDINNSVCLLKHTINPCSLAYIVTRKGALNLVEYFKNNGFLYATDRNFNNYLLNKNIFYGSKKILCTGNPDFGSDIF